MSGRALHGHLGQSFLLTRVEQQQKVLHGVSTQDIVLPLPAPLPLPLPVSTTTTATTTALRITALTIVVVVAVDVIVVVDVDAVDVDVVVLRVRVIFFFFGTFCNELHEGLGYRGLHLTEDGSQSNIRMSASQI